MWWVMTMYLYAWKVETVENYSFENVVEDLHFIYMCFSKCNWYGLADDTNNGIASVSL